jgi:phosphatidylglycerol:prolipoprotein diacylglycerol transferase
VVEFFRADVERGVVSGFGVGQWTSLAIFLAGATIWATARARAAATRTAAA